MKDQNKQNNKK